MRRRARAVPDPAPAELLTYRPGDWRQDNCPFGVWTAARKQWADRYGWPGGTLARLRGQERQRPVSGDLDAA